MIQNSLRRLVRIGPELDRADDYYANAEDDDCQRTPEFVAQMDESKVESDTDSDQPSQSSGGEEEVVPIRRTVRFPIGDGSKM
ncbi:hypothetical protein ON010_g7415 [Phytophthora cinnamomi]|nr:hypothetical protein ON010_g7415 [Phytophthora cinnamomi]